MVNFIMKNLKKVALLFFVIGLFSFYPLSILTMAHNSTGMDHEMITMPNIMEASGIGQCLNFHLNLMHVFSQSLPLTSSLFIVLIVSLALALFGVSIKALINIFFASFRIKYKRLRKRSLEVFFRQLGFWLVFAHQKSFAHAFALA